MSILNILFYYIFINQMLAILIIEHEVFKSNVKLTFNSKSKNINYSDIQLFSVCLFVSSMFSILLIPILIQFIISGDGKGD